MSDTALFLGVAAMLCAAYALHGGWLSERWGVDPSRRTMGAQTGRTVGRRICDALFAVGMIVLQLWLMCGVFGFFASLCGETAGIIIGVLYVVLCGTIGFAVLFVCVRTGKDLAHLAHDELFGDTKDLAYILELVMLSSLTGLMLTVKYLTMPADVFLWWIAVLWLAVVMMAVSHRLAGKICDERRMRPMTYGISVFSGIVAMSCYAIREKMRMLPDPYIAVLGIPFLIYSVLIPVCLGGDAIRGLLESELPKKKRTPGFIWTILSCILGIAMAFVPEIWLRRISLIAGTGYIFLAGISCMKWMNRIGRGLFSRY